MKTVTVIASRKYDIKIGPGLLTTLGAEVAALGKVQKVCIVSETTVWPLYGAEAEASLHNAGLETTAFVFPAGEENKNASTYISLLEHLAAHRLTRSDIIVALGGGVVGDLAGFAAATYLRGIRFVQVPTTLLAAVDSSVGGKTAIDLTVGKNLAGAFWQPSAVLCDTDTLNTLPEEIFLDGCAEVIKYAVLYHEPFFSYLEQTGPQFDREDVIAQCVEMKRKAVMADEFDTGARMLLNLGHTLGHGVEAGSGFTISHGKAVAIGLAMVARACGCADASRIEALLEKFCLPTHTELPSQTILDCALADKKRSGATVNLILPEKIGSCAIVPTNVDSLLSFIEAGY